ncbi:MAG: hypothetical protein BWY76_02414 [bacterium ADurb.Bin429]|nr:MAG: hypothetical protein BWY76_02414 [bacterium ADurb.Bin429]
MKAITLSLLTIALAMGVTATWASDIAADQQARIQHAKDIVTGKRAALTGLHHTIADRKAPYCEKAQSLAAERSETAKETCRQKCEMLRDAESTPSAREKTAPAPPCDSCQ